MARWQGSNNSAFTVTAAAAIQILPPITGDLKRIQVIITNVGTKNITLTKGSTPAVLNKGIVLLPNSAFFEANDNGFQCWQGAIQGISDTSNTDVAISETFESLDREEF